MNLQFGDCGPSFSACPRCLDRDPTVPARTSALDNPVLTFPSCPLGSWSLRSVFGSTLLPLGRLLPEGEAPRYTAGLFVFWGSDFRTSRGDTVRVPPGAAAGCR